MNNNTKRQLNRKRIAADLSAILNNPETPESLFNAIQDQLCFFQQFLDYNDANVIEMSLLAYDERGNNQQPDITSNGELSVIVGGVQ